MDTKQIFEVGPILFREWKVKLETDGMFEDEKDPNNWIVNESNLEEFLEAL